MKSFILLAVFCALALATSCGNTDPTSIPSPSQQTSVFGEARIVVHVYFDNQGIPGIKVEVLGLGRIKTTDDDGIAVFRVPAGTYTVRAYNINRGGPILSYVDTKVKVIASESTRVEIFDCLPCD